MITISSNKCNTFNQKNYDELIENLPFHKLTCSCGRKGCLIKHGYYKRSIKVNGALITIKMLRVICKSCNKTHAVIPESIVPYSRISLKDQLEIINYHINNLSFESLMTRNYLIDENNIRYIINNFIKHWRERLKSFDIHLDENLVDLCFKFFDRQFMQIKCTSNILFS